MTPHGPILQSGCGERQSLLLTHMYSNQNKSACTALLHPYDSLSLEKLSLAETPVHTERVVVRSYWRSNQDTPVSSLKALAMAKNTSAGGGDTLFDRVVD